MKAYIEFKDVSDLPETLQQDIGKIALELQTEGVKFDSFKTESVIRAMYLMSESKVGLQGKALAKFLTSEFCTISETLVSRVKKACAAWVVHAAKAGEDISTLQNEEAICLKQVRELGSRNFLEGPEWETIANQKKAEKEAEKAGQATRNKSSKSQTEGGGEATDEEKSAGQKVSEDKPQLDQAGWLKAVDTLRDAVVNRKIPVDLKFLSEAAEAVSDLYSDLMTVESEMLEIIAELDDTVEKAAA